MTVHSDKRATLQHYYLGDIYGGLVVLIKMYFVIINEHFSGKFAKELTTF